MMKQRIFRVCFLVLTISLAFCAMALGVSADAACEHTGGTATCTEKAVCTACGQSYGELAAHNPGDGATCTAAQTCTECGEELAAALGHTEAVANLAEGTHKIYCSVCDDTITESESCYGGHATCEYRAVCDACDTAYGALPTGHDYGEDWIGSEIYHFHACEICGSPKLSDRAEHTYGEWTKTLSPTAEADGRSERTCSVCGYTQSKAIPQLPPKRMSTFAIVAIVVGSVLVVAIGAFAIVWFAVKKKTFKDIADLFKKKPAEESEAPADEKSDDSAGE